MKNKTRYGEHIILLLVLLCWQYWTVQHILSSVELLYVLHVLQQRWFLTLLDPGMSQYIELYTL